MEVKAAWNQAGTSRSHAGVRASRLTYSARSGGFRSDQGFSISNLGYHVHVPEGAIPKDVLRRVSPISHVIVSALTKIPVRCDVTMNAAKHLAGKVLPIGWCEGRKLWPRTEWACVP